MSSPAVASELTNWKEIAAYLGVSVKTAQVWERDRGLPIRRLPGGHGRVAIDVAALEAWKHSNAQPNGRPRPRRYVRFALIAVVLLAGVLLTAFLVGRGNRPSGIRIGENVLTVLDARERVLWTKTFDHSLLPGESLSGAGQFRRRFWIGDLRGDGRTEVLFVDAPWTHGERSHVLICYSDRGEELWSFTPGKSVATTTASFAPPFTVLRFLVSPMGRGRPNSIVVSSAHFLQYPTQVALLSSNGQLEREYWHAGRFTELGIADLDGDGVNEIYLGGVNNARHQATLVVLDPDKFSGASTKQVTTNSKDSCQASSEHGSSFQEAVSTGRSRLTTSSANCGSTQWASPSTSQKGPRQDQSSPTNSTNNSTYNKSPSATPSAAPTRPSPPTNNSTTH
jgi:hypothetical protein